MPGSVIVSGARTPIGKLSGALSGLSAAELGAAAIASALERATLRPDQVDYVYMGQILQAGQGQLTARQAAVKAGIPLTTPATVVNKLCLSGLNAIYLADQMISSGEADIVVAGGMESMTRAPYLLLNARSGYRYGDGVLVDSMLLDALTCSFDHAPMGLATDQYNDNVISRQRQDTFAAASHEKAAKAVKDGRMDEEIVAITVPQRRGDPITVDTDEGIRAGTTPESLSRLKPAFSDVGSITAGNSSQLSDGGAAVILTSRPVAERIGVQPLGEFVSYGQVAGPSPSLLHQPANAVKKALAKAGTDIADVDLFEISEAFAAVALASMDALKVPGDRVNVNGGAIALGHPVGMSGTRLALTALYELRRRGGGRAVVSLCGGGGQGDALGSPFILLSSRLRRPDRHGADRTARSAASTTQELPGTGPVPSALVNDEFPVDVYLADPDGQPIGVGERSRVRNRVGAKKDQIGCVIRFDVAATGDMEAVRRLTGHLAHRVLETEDAFVPDVAAQHPREGPVEAGMGTLGQRVPCHRHPVRADN